MGTWFKWIYSAGALLLLGLVLLWGVSKLVDPSRAERAALATMSEPVVLEGRNTYPAIWLLDYPVPEAKRASILAEDVRRFTASRPSGLDPNDTSPVFLTKAATRYPTDRLDQTGYGRLCKGKENCLDKVRGDLIGYQQLVEAHAAWFARIEQMTSADHFSNPFPARPDMPMPSFASSYAPATAQAIRFASADRQRALSATCKSLSDWRRLTTNTDMLLAWAIADTYGGKRYGRLLADMLAELPNDEPLPVECGVALEALQSAEISMCHAMRGEFRFISQGVDMAMREQLRRKGAGVFVFYDGDMTRAMMAGPLASYCSPKVEAAFAADQPLPPISYPGMWRLQCVANYIGCVLANIGSPSFERYGQRHSDALAAKRLLSALPWWRQQPDAMSEPAAVFKRLPDIYRSASHPVALNADKTALVMKMLGPDFGDEEWVLPLPGSKVQAHSAQN